VEKTKPCKKKRSPLKCMIDIEKICPNPLTCFSISHAEVTYLNNYEYKIWISSNLIWFLSDLCYSLV